MDFSRSDEESCLAAIGPGFRLLVVDDEPLMRSALRRALRQQDCEIVLAADGGEAVAILEQASHDSFAMAIVDLHMPGMNGHELLREIKRRSPATQVVMLTGHGTIGDAVRAMRAGADDFLTKPFDPEALQERIRAAARLRDLKRAGTAAADGTSANLVGRSPPMQRLRVLAQRMGASNATLLIQGESGTGKEEFARAVHGCGKRRTEPFVPVDLASIGRDVIGSELFGHAKGAFTSATAARIGLIRSAGRGTIFLDEIGELPLAMQTTLLRVIQEREVRPVGSEEVHPVEARVIAATNRNLAEMVRRGEFREDLYHRLNVVEVTMPPLRQRRADIPELAHHFLAKYLDERPTIQGIAPDTLALLTLHDWPGNIRELENAVLRAVVVGSTELLEPGDLPLQVARSAAGGSAFSAVATGDTEMLDGPVDREPAAASLAACERDAIVAALAESNGNRQQAADILGIGVATLYRKLKRYGIR